MWEKAENDDEDLHRLLTALKASTYIPVTDGLYNKDSAPLVSGAGWVLCFKATGKCLVGSFFETSHFASSYRAKRLGLLALHVLLGTLQDHFNGNKLALFKGSESKWCVPTGEAGSAR